MLSSIRRVTTKAFQKLFDGSYCNTLSGNRFNNIFLLASKQLGCKTVHNINFGDKQILDETKNQYNFNNKMLIF